MQRSVVTTYNPSIFGAIMLAVHVILLLVGASTPLFLDASVLDMVRQSLLIPHFVAAAMLFFLAGRSAVRQSWRRNVGWFAGLFRGLVYAVSAFFFSKLLFSLFPGFFNEAPLHDAFCQGPAYCLLMVQPIFRTSILDEVLVEGLLVGWLMGAFGSFVELRQPQGLLLSNWIRAALALVLLLVVGCLVATGTTWLAVNHILIQ